MRVLTIKTPSSTWFSTRLLAWYDQHGRHNLPWKSPNTPYRIWLSEVMLQQTQVKTVLPYFDRFTQRFESIDAIANASLDEILHLWTGLGYYARGRSLHKAAKMISEKHQGEVPQSLDALIALPGIGRSTAGAILAQAFEIRAPILEGNVKRVLSRFTALPGWSGKPAVEKALWKLSEHFTPNDRLNDYTQAIMDLGATVCTLRSPKCERCPVQEHCQAYQTQQTDIFPYKKEKKVLPYKQKTFMCIINSAHQILLVQPSTTGLWGGLWQFPEAEAINSNALLPLATIEAQRHTFSHYHLDYTVHVLGAPEGLSPASFNLDFPSLWHAVDEPRGLPGPIEKFIRTKARKLASSWYKVCETIE